MFEKKFFDSDIEPRCEYCSNGYISADGKNVLCKKKGVLFHTDAVQAGAFVKETGIAALACSFGTTHGLYITKPQLDFSVVENVRKETDGIPVVMHGGSGVSEEDFGKSIAAGVRKVNYFTYMDKAAGEVLTAYMEEVKAAGTPVFFAEPARRARQAMKENVIGAMKVFAGMN